MQNQRHILNKWNFFISNSEDLRQSSLGDIRETVQFSSFASPTSDCRPSLSCPLHSQHCIRRSCLTGSAHGTVHACTQDLAETDYCWHWHLFCWCTYWLPNVGRWEQSQRLQGGAQRWWWWWWWTGGVHLPTLRRFVFSAYFVAKRYILKKLSKDVKLPARNCSWGHTTFNPLYWSWALLCVALQTDDVQIDRQTDAIMMPIADRILLQYIRSAKSEKL